MPVGVVLLKLMGHIQSGSTADSEPKPDILRSLAAGLALATSLLRMSDSGGSGFGFQLPLLLLLFWAFWFKDCCAITITLEALC